MTVGWSHDYLSVERVLIVLLVELCGRSWTLRGYL